MIYDFLRIDRWLRPERSGAIAVLTAYMLLCGWGELNGYKGDDGKPSLLCTVAPFCPQCLRQPERPREREPVRVVTRVYFGKGLKIAKKEHRYCKYEARRTGDAVIYGQIIQRDPKLGNTTFCERMEMLFGHYPGGTWLSGGEAGEWRWCFVDDIYGTCRLEDR